MFLFSIFNVFLVHVIRVLEIITLSSYEQASRLLLSSANVDQRKFTPLAEISGNKIGNDFE